MDRGDRVRPDAGLSLIGERRRMDEFQVFVAVLAINACVLGVALFAVYQFNKVVSRCGR